MSIAIGIDLGTTNTVVAAVMDGVAVTLEDDQGRRLLPSVVSFHPSSTVLVGEPARERRLIDPENSVFSVKPLLGRAWDSEEVKAARTRFPFQLTQGAKNSTMVLARDVAYALPEISAFVLRRAKAIAEAALGQPVERAVITVPANFNDLQRASTKIAGKLAGLDVMRILNEPTAAALAYGQSISKAEKIAVFDLGGGTFDITLLDLTGNVFEVLATAGDTALGGDDVDRILAERIAHEVMRRFNVDPRLNPASGARLMFMAEEIKKELSNAYQSQREITGIGYTEQGNPIVLPFVMTRDEIDALARPLVERTISVARQSIDIIGIQPRAFDRVILVGGSTRMPLVARMVEQLFGQPPHLKVNPDEVVALGAAIQAHALNRSKAAHKRKSAHDQLANAHPKATGEFQTSPPDAGDPTLVQPTNVPKPAPLPMNLGTPVGQTSPPEFFTFNKAPATISFGSSMPPANTAPTNSPVLKGRAAPPPPPVPPGKPPPLPPRANKPPPPAPTTTPKRGGTDHQAPLSAAAARATTRPIDGAPSAHGPPAEEPSGPKPARARVPSLDLPKAPTPTAPPTLQLGLESGTDIVAAPKLDLDMPVEMLSAALRANPRHSPAQQAAPVVDRTLVMQAQGQAQQRHQQQQASSPLDLAAVSPHRFQQGTAIATSASTPLLIDVTPLSLGVETAGGYADILIPANSPVPCEKTRIFFTASDAQTMVSIRVSQGQSSRFAANTRLGDLVLSGLRPARRGEVKIAVTFELDADGILNVRARDQDTGRETAASMKLLGTSTDVEDVGAMMARQARHVVA